MRRFVATVVVLSITFGIGVFVGQGTRVQAQSPGRILEVRTYTVNEGKMPALLKQFRDQLPLFEKNGMPAIFYGVAAEEPRSNDTFIYVLTHESRESAKKSWAGFVADPIFRAAGREADQGGKAVAKIDSLFVNPTDFSPLK
jgi:hypothetical protein